MIQLAGRSALRLADDKRLRGAVPELRKDGTVMDRKDELA